MLLLIDAGNTKIKWAIWALDHKPGDWLECQSVSQHDVGMLAHQWINKKITHCFISNVAGEAMLLTLTEQITAAGIHSSQMHVLHSQAQYGGIQNHYRNPQQLGSDRFASLIAAHYLFPTTPLLVVTCGTATTVDAIDAEGNFNGGMILPGLGTMAQSLALNTARLPEVSPVDFKAVFADNTKDAIISGCINAQIGAVMRALEHLQQTEVLCIFSGGSAQYIAPYMPRPCQQIENLVLIGLAASYLTELEV